MTEQLDIRDINPGVTYWVVVRPDGRCVLNGMFIAAFLDRETAKIEASKLGAGHLPVKSYKPL